MFRRAILQSMPGMVLTPELAADVTCAIAERLGRPPTLAELRAVPPEELRDATDAVVADMTRYTARWGALAVTITPFSPVVDGTVLPATPWEALRAGGTGVELIAGCNRDEYRLFTELPKLAGQPPIEAAAATAALDVLVPGGESACRTAHPDADPAHLFELAMTEWGFRIPTLRLAEANLAAGGTTYLYELQWPSPAFGGVLGACHALDIPLVFGHLDDASALLPLLGPTPPPEAFTLSELIRAEWTEFAATGDPGWPAYTEPGRETRLYDTESGTGPYPHEVSRRLWAEHAFAPLRLATLDS